MGENRIRVLLIEDNPRDVELIGTLLSRRDPAISSDIGFALGCACSLTEGLERLSEGVFDVVLLDLSLPDSRGLETFTSLRERFPNVPVLILSGNVNFALALQAVRRGAQDIIVKGDVLRSHLQRFIIHAVERHKLRSQLEVQTREAGAVLANLRTIIEKNADGMVVVGRDGIIRFANPAAEALLGWKKEDLIGAVFGHPAVAREKAEIDLFAAGRAARTAEMQVAEVDWEGERALLASLRDVTENKAAEEEREAYIRRLERLHLLTRKIRSSHESHEVLQFVVDSAAELLNVPNVGLYIVDGEGLVLKGWRGPYYKNFPQPHRLGWEGRGAFVAKEGKICYVEDVPSDSVWLRKKRARKHGIGSYLGVPLKFGNRVLGVLNCLYRDVRRIGSQEMQLIEIFADAAAIEIQNAQLHEEADRNLQFFRSLVEENADAIVICDMERRITLWNKGAERLYGYPQEEVLGRNIAFLIPGSELPARRARFEETILGGRSESFETRRSRKDGTEVPVSVTLSPIRSSDGKVVAYTGIHRDLTRRIQAEEHLRQLNQALMESERRYATLVGNLPGMAYRCLNDPDWTMQFASEGCYDLTGYPPDDLVGKRISYGQELIHPDDRQYVWEIVQDALRRRANFQIQYRIRARGGKEKWVWEQGLGVFSSDGELLALEGFILDVTERKEAEKVLRDYSKTLEETVRERTLQFKRATEEAREAVRAKAQFLANMSHELRTPLNSIIGFSELLEDGAAGKLEGRQGRYVSNILTSGRHLLELINDLLDLSKLETGKRVPQIQEFDVARGLGFSVELARPLAQKKGLSLSLGAARGLPMIHADPSMFRQIMDNLLSNAIKFTPEGGKVEVSAALPGGEAFEERFCPSRGGYVMVSIADTGIGISPEDQERIFEQFEQVDSSYARTQQGTGLGLALTRKLVRLQGGSIWVRSEEGEGSTFTFVLPVRTGQATAPGRPSAVVLADGGEGG